MSVFLNENEYQEYFKGKLKEYGVKSPKELSDEEQKKFFAEIKNRNKSEDSKEEPKEEGTADVPTDECNKK